MSKRSQNRTDIAPTGQPKEVAYKWSHPGQMGEFRMVDKWEFQIDRRYQRNENSRRVLSIAGAFTWELFGVVCARWRGGKLFVTDAQNRVLAARKRTDISLLPTLVFPEGAIEDEAKAFLGANTLRKPATKLEQLNALVMTGDPNALRAIELAKSINRDFGYSGGIGIISCTGKVLHLLTVSRTETETVWPLVGKLCEGHAFNERLLDGLVYIEQRLSARGETLGRGRWRDRALAVGYDRLMDGANRAASFFKRGGAKHWAIGIVEEMNKGLRIRIDIDSPKEVGAEVTP